MASLKDVAKLANVSLMTVSRAINEPQRLRPETYQTVMAAVEALGYVSDASARKIRGAKSTVNTIGVLALDTMTDRGDGQGPRLEQLRGEHVRQ